MTPGAFAVFGGKPRVVRLVRHFRYYPAAPPCSHYPAPPPAVITRRAPLAVITRFMRVIQTQTGGFAVWLLDYPDKPGNDKERSG